MLTPHASASDRVDAGESAIGEDPWSGGEDVIRCRVTHRNHFRILW